MIAIIDYDAGNIKSVEKALQKLGAEVVITKDAQKILAADKVILPGVGAFGDAMSNLKRYGLDVVIHQVIEKGIPFLGICLGMQTSVMEFARHVCKLKDANSTEFDAKVKYPVIHLIDEQKDIQNKGGTMRLGLYDCQIKAGTLASKLY